MHSYFMVPVHEEDRAFLKFSFQERTYQFKCLPFGLACAPWVFTKTLKPLAPLLRQLGMRLIVYIDDILFLAESKELAWDHVIPLVYLLENLGFVISKTKVSGATGGFKQYSYWCAAPQRSQRRC